MLQLLLPLPMQELASFAMLDSWCADGAQTQWQLMGRASVEELQGPQVLMCIRAASNWQSSLNDVLSLAWVLPIACTYHADEVKKEYRKLGK